MLPGRTHVPHDCRIVADVLARIGDKWSVFAVMLLGERDYRFAELQRAMGGISKRMLSLTPVSYTHLTLPTICSV